MTALRLCFNWLQLARVSALPTAISNIMLGYLLAGTHAGMYAGMYAGTIQWIDLLSVVLASTCLYTGGMILNDVFDIEQDRKQRPERPLPSGRIGVGTARTVGFALLFLGIGLAATSSWLNHSEVNFDFLRPILVASLLAVSILAYDQWLKRTSLAPGLMGACRTLNLLLGASVVAGEIASPSTMFGFEPVVLAIAVSLGLYVAGITLVGRKEAVDNPARFPLWLGAGLILIGVLGFSFSNSWFSDGEPRNQRLAENFPWLMLLLAFPVVRRAISAATRGTRQAMQTAVVTGLRSIIVFDAALCFLAAPDRPGYALFVLGLLIPSVILGRWLNPT